jgi:hypothetical protein
VPANPNALHMGLRSGAIERSDVQELSSLLRTITLGGPQPAPSPVLQALARQLRTILRS